MPIKNPDRIHRMMFPVSWKEACLTKVHLMMTDTYSKNGSMTLDEICRLDMTRPEDYRKFDTAMDDILLY